MLKATFEIDGEEKLYDSLLAEKDDLESNRAKVTIIKKNNIITLTLIAQDFASFRALESAIIRLLTTYYKMKTVGE